ncbi:MAG: ricin-type beta-trefoil lectin domain protein [Micromonosporaceae bacterium]
MRLPALTIAAVCAALVLTPIPAAAERSTTTATRSASTTAPAEDGIAAELEAMQRDLDLTAAEASLRLTHEAAAPYVAKRVRKTLGDRFGGAWYDADRNRLAVGVTSPADAARVRAAGAVPVEVKRTERDLDTVKAKLDRSLSRRGNALYAWYVDVPGNRVVVAAATRAAAERAIAASGVDDSAVRIVTRRHAPRPVYDVRGGDQYGINNSVLCSVGFSVAGGFVTAGHCGSAGSSTTGYNGVSQGTFQGSSFPGNDYAWVRVNSNWTPRPWVNNYSGGNVGVAGSQEAVVGSSVCRSGRTTGWRCGTIEAKNVTVNYGNGSYVYGLTQTSACAEPGDSGGSYVTGNQAQGVTSGGSGNCSSGGRTFFQPVNEILSVYGLSLTTTGGGSTSRIIGQQSGKCIDVPYSNGADGQYLWIWNCNGTAAQNWTFPGDGTIRAFGLCMDVAWGSTQNGAVIQLARCSGNPAQQFVLSGAGDLVNPQANKCVDVKDWNTANGARLHLWDCHGGANQKWRRG